MNKTLQSLVYWLCWCRRFSIKSWSQTLQKPSSFLKSPPPPPPLAPLDRPVTGCDITQCNSTLKIVPVASACVLQPIRGQYSGHVIPVDQSEARTLEFKFPITAELLSHSITLKIIRVTPQNINTHIKSFAEEDGRTFGLLICQNIS